LNSPVFTAGQIERFALRVYRACGVAEADAALLSNSLCQADCWAHQSHGVMRTFWYAKRIVSRATDIRARPEIVTNAGAVAVMDGHNGIGQVVAQHAMDDAVSRAKAHGIGAVAVRNSGHFGTAMYFTRQAAQAGCIGLLFTNASPAMAPWGGRQKLLGTNPWSIAAPAGRHAPMMLDIANTAVARGKLYLARQRAEPIPTGWAIDSGGAPTTDPVEGIAGAILPLAGHKGYAIATMVDMLSGVLSGSSFLGRVVGPYEPDGNSGVGHLAIALHINAFRPLAQFETDIEDMIAAIKRTPKAAGTYEIYYPGELEAINDARNRQTGIAVPVATVDELNAGARSLGVSDLGE